MWGTVIVILLILSIICSVATITSKQIVVTVPYAVVTYGLSFVFAVLALLIYGIRFYRNRRNPIPLFALKVAMYGTMMLSVACVGLLIAEVVMNNQ